MDSIISKVPLTCHIEWFCTIKGKMYLLFSYTILLVYFFCSRWTKVSKKIRRFFLFKRNPDPTYRVNIDQSNMLLNQTNTFIPTSHLILSVIVEHPCNWMQIALKYFHWSRMHPLQRQSAPFLRQFGLNIFLLLSLNLTPCGFYFFFPSCNLLEGYT